MEGARCQKLSEFLELGGIDESSDPSFLTNHKDKSIVYELPMGV
jgi:hypothetical protein